MTKQDVLEEINNIFIDVLDEETLAIKEETTAQDVEGWDSLTHIQLVVGIEKKFKIRFNSKEIQSWKNIGEMANSVLDKI